MLEQIVNILSVRQSIKDELLICLRSLYEQEERYLDGLEDEFETACQNLVRSFTEHLSPYLCAQDTSSILPKVPLYELLPNVPQAISNCVHPLQNHLQLFAHFRRTMESNYRSTSYLHGTKSAPIHQFKGTPKECVEFVRSTPLKRLFYTPVPLELPVRQRLTHHWIVGAIGTGKTTVLRTMILDDLKRVARGECSIIVIDSQQQIIPEIANLRMFAPGHSLHGKLIHVDPSDREHPMALSLFDLEGGQQTSAIELIEFVLSSLSEQAVTGAMKAMLTNLTIACLNIPNATILTLEEMLYKEPRAPFPPHIQPFIDSLPDQSRNFFAKQFDQMKPTKDALSWRLNAILSKSPELKRMFSHSKTNLKLRNAMAEGKIILIDTDKQVVGEGGAQLLGRFFIALIGRVSELRKSDSELPCFLYIDEAGDYLEQPSKKFETMLDQARKKHIGVILSHQRLEQIASGTKDAIATHAEIKFASTGENDAPTVARYLKTKADQVAKRHATGKFAVYIDKITPRAIDVQFPETKLTKLPQMTREEAKTVREEMRAAYSAPLPPQTPASKPQKKGSKW